MIRPEGGRRVPGLSEGESAAGVIPAFPVYLFDIDGTLLDSAQDICGAVQQVLESTAPARLTFDYLKGYIGRHLIDLFRRCASRVPPQEQMDECWSSNTAASISPAATARPASIPESPKASPLLGGRKSTATTKGTPTTRAVLEQFGLIQHFDHVQGTDGFPCKPAPDVIFTALEAHRSAARKTASSSATPPPTWKPAAAPASRPAPSATATGSAKTWRAVNPDYWIDDLRELTP